jgi:hypothetical protein
LTQIIAILAIFGVLFSGLAQTTNSQILSPKKDKEEKKTEKSPPRIKTLRPGEIIDYRIDPSDPTKNSMSLMRPRKLMFADCASRGRDKGMWLLDGKGDTLQHVSSRGGHASWASDRLRAVCIDPRLNMKILNLGKQGKGVVIKTPEFLTPEMPAWSPKADVIAFGARDRYDSRQIFVVDANAEATNLKQLTHDTVSSYMPSWNTDGTAIIFSRHQGKKGLYSVSSSGGPVTPFFVSDTIYLTETIWSPTGKYLVGTNRLDGNVYRLDTDGTNPLNLTKTGSLQSHFGNPRFMNDGATVIFAGKVPGRNYPTMFTIPIEGGERKEFRKPDALHFSYCSPNF